MNLSQIYQHQDFMDQMPGAFFIQDTQSKFLICNKAGVAWTGFKSSEEMIGKTYHEMRCKAANQHEAWIFQDSIIINNNHGHGKIIGLYCYSNSDWKLVLADKYPFIDTNGKIIALGVYVNDITHSRIIDITRFLNFDNELKPRFERQQSGYLIQNYHQDFEFSDKQSICLFFLLRGKTAKEIGYVIGISKRTVEKHIDDLKNKMKCVSKPQLIEKAISHGYMNFIPDKLIA